MIKSDCMSRVSGHELELRVQDFNLAGVEGCGQEEPSDRRPDLSSVKREVRS